MTYFNNLNLSGVMIDGQPDDVMIGSLSWEMVTGEAGSLIISHFIRTDLEDFSWSSYYSDNVDPAVEQCTGDEFEFSTSGIWIKEPIPTTDPLDQNHSNVTIQRTIIYEKSDISVEKGDEQDTQNRTPLQVTIEQL